jgi:hypothetical protein
MALGSTPPLIEMNTRNLSGGKGRSARKADLSAICELIIQKMWEPQRLTTLRVSMTRYRDSFTSFLCGFARYMETSVYGLVQTRLQHWWKTELPSMSSESLEFRWDLWNGFVGYMGKFVYDIM